ncbi:hypothetical protein TURTL08_23400 [Turicimonas sp. TL08]
MGDALWAPSYFAASCGGAPIFIIKQYIEQQNTPDRKNYYIRPLYHRPKGRCFTGRSDKIRKLFSKFEQLAKKTCE